MCAQINSWKILMCLGLSFNRFQHVNCWGTHSVHTAKYEVKRMIVKKKFRVMAMTLNWECLCFPDDIWSCLQTFWLSQRGKCYWDLVGGVQGCYHAQDSPALPAKNCLPQNVQILRKIWFRGKVKGQVGSSQITWGMELHIAWRRTSRQRWAQWSRLQARV